MPDQLAVLGDDTYLHQEAGQIDISVGGGQPGFTQTVGGVVEIK
jgi:hypothetical protein